MANRFRYYVYALIDGRDHSAFYIGKGTGNRCHDHMRAWRKGTETNYKKSNRISEIIACGKSVTVQILADGLTETSALRLEREIIRELGIKSLTNIQPGSMSEWERAALGVKEALSQIKAFDAWKAERPRSVNAIILYHAIKGELQEMLRFASEQMTHGKA